MRRSDREVTDPEKIRAIIDRCTCCRLGFWDRQEVYILPLNFGYEEAEGKRVFYFHSAKEGRKIGLIAGAPRVGFELDTNYQLHEAETACAHSARFQSVIGTGTVQFVMEEDERRKALCSLMQHNTGRADWAFTPEQLNAVAIYRLDVETLSAKEHA